MNLNNSLEQTVAEHPQEIALHYQGGDVSYTKMHEAVRRMAGGLSQLGVVLGDRVAICLPNVPHFPIAYYAALNLGAVVVPINIMHKGREVSWLLEDSEARVLVIWSGLLDGISRQISNLNSLKHIVVLGDTDYPDAINMTKMISRSKPNTDIADLEENDPAVVQYTSGVTGTPKGAILTHGNIYSNITACRELMSMTSDDIIIAALPFFHSMGQTLQMHLAFLTGAGLQLHPNFEPEVVFKTFADKSASVFIGVPSMYHMLFNYDNKIDESIEKTLRLCICGGGTIAEEVLKGFEKEFKTYILECYTMVETSPVVSFNQWRTGRRVGSLGHPIPGVEMKVANDQDEEVAIGEIGEILVKGSGVMKGYINRPISSEEALRDGWFHTGDLGKMDINGFYYLVDRLNDRIMKGGFSIYPSEVEGVLYGHPDIKEAVVIPILNDVMGQEVKACIVLRDGSDITKEQIISYCEERMARYKIPVVISYYKDLPLTAAGKIDKSKLTL